MLFRCENKNCKNYYKNLEERKFENPVCCCCCGESMGRLFEENVEDSFTINDYSIDKLSSENFIRDKQIKIGDHVLKAKVYYLSILKEVAVVFVPPVGWLDSTFKIVDNIESIKNE